MMKNCVFCFLMTSLLGCASDPVIQYETITVYKDRYIPIPESLTNHGDLIELPEAVDVLALGVAYKMQKIRAAQCYGQLDEIRGLGDG